MHSRRILIAVAALAPVFLSGCFVLHPPCVADKDLERYRTLATLPEPTPSAYPPGQAPLTTEMPLFVDEQNPPPSWELTLDEVVRIGLENSKVLRDLGGSVLRTPALAQTVHDPAIQATDPRFGMEGALAAFDAQLTTRLFAQKNDRAFNNLFLGGGAFLFDQDLSNFDTQLTKLTATGASFTVRHHTDYDNNNAPANLFASSWNTNYETEFRQPLLQGYGVEFNRIAGPRSIPGVYNGVVIARINNDISTAEFEVALRDFLSNLENAYWDLYYAYRDLDAKIAARDTALRTWRIIQANVEAGRGYSKLQEVQTLEQYYRFQEEVLDALGGRVVDRTRTNNGSGGGTFRAIGGVHAAERRLRLWMGLPINDGRLIRPTDEPAEAKIDFDWDSLVQEALSRRPELRRQQSQVERMNMELCAAQNFLLPRLDLIGRYRWRGFGHDLIGAADPANPFDNAYANLTSGQFQEWELGFEYTMPIGFRREYAAVRNAQFRIAREKAILEEQQRQAVHDLTAAVADATRAHVLMQTSANRLAAAQDQFRRANDAFFELGGKVSLELVLDARIRLADAETGYHRARVDYALSIKNVQFEKGSLLEYNGAVLADGTECWQAPISPCRIASTKSPRFNYILAHPAPVRPGSEQAAIEYPNEPRQTVLEYHYDPATVARDSAAVLNLNQDYAYAEAHQNPAMPRAYPVRGVPNLPKPESMKAHDASSGVAMPTPLVNPMPVSKSVPTTASKTAPPTQLKLEQILVKEKPAAEDSQGWISYHDVEVPKDSPKGLLQRLPKVGRDDKANQAKAGDSSSVLR